MTTTLPAEKAPVVPFEPIQLRPGHFLIDPHPKEEWSYIRDEDAFRAQGGHPGPYVGHHKHHNHVARFTVIGDVLICEECSDRFPFEAGALTFGHLRASFAKDIGHQGDCSSRIDGLEREVATLRGELEEIRRQFGASKIRDVAQNPCATFIDPRRDDESKTIGGFVGASALS